MTMHDVSAMSSDTVRDALAQQTALAAWLEDHPRPAHDAGLGLLVRSRLCLDWVAREGRCILTAETAAGARESLVAWPMEDVPSAARRLARWVAMHGVQP